MSAHTLIAAAALALAAATAGHADAADGRFFVPPVIGAAYQDRSVATDPDQVRRQGGFGPAAAVRWVPAPPVAGSDAPVAVAQATTTLEAIDAIRMLTPEQLRRRDATRETLVRSSSAVRVHHEAALR